MVGFFNDNFTGCDTPVGGNISFFSESLNHSLIQAIHSKYHYNALLGDMHHFMYGIIFMGGAKIVMLCIKY